MATTTSQASNEKGVTIFINGRPREVTARELTFEQIVALAGLAGGNDAVYTVVYTRGHGEKPAGSLVAGSSVKIKDEMVFDVTSTIRS